MQQIVAPQDIRMANPRWPSLFLAGGITGCKHWQLDALEFLKNHEVNVFNPRRLSWTSIVGVTDNGVFSAYEQIKWEQQALEKANMISFWFAAETVQPIVLLELGLWCRSGKPIVVGIDPSYPRKQDVQIQLEHYASQIIPRETWEGFKIHLSRMVSLMTKDFKEFNF